MPRSADAILNDAVAVTHRVADGSLSDLRTELRAAASDAELAALRDALAAVEPRCAHSRTARAFLDTVLHTAA